MYPSLIDSNVREVLDGILLKEIIKIMFLGSKAAAGA
jgi:hypothetical protein